MVPTPDSPAELDADRAFEQRRPRLFGLAYRMLGTRADAEDAVQDAYLRWHDAERSTIRNVDHWLATVVARLRREGAIVIGKT
ncbi:MAG: sigma factor, partial [Pseudomonadota bacterium]